MEDQVEKIYTPENILRKMKRDRQVAEERAQQVLSKMNAKKRNRSEILKPETFIRQQRTSVKSHQIIKKRGNKAKKSVNDDVNEQLVFVIRIRGINNVSEDLKKIFNSLRLKEVNTGVFLQMDNKLAQTLKTIDPYVTYGTVNKKTLSELIYKKGHCSSDSKRQPLNNNVVVEKELGSIGVICLEDIVHELKTLGENFRKVNKFLCPFKLSNIDELLKNLKKPFHSGGQWGNRQENINELILKMI